MSKSTSSITSLSLWRRIELLFSTTAGKLFASCVWCDDDDDVDRSQPCAEVIDVTESSLVVRFRIASDADADFWWFGFTSSEWFVRSNGDVDFRSFNSCECCRRLGIQQKSVNKIGFVKLFSKKDDQNYVKKVIEISQSFDQEQ